MNSRILTLARLEELRACNQARTTFHRIFGSQVEVTVERFSQPDVIEADFDYYWAADLLLPVEQRQAYYVELRTRMNKILTERDISYTWEIPWEERGKMEATTWADFYVKYGLDQSPRPVSIVDEQAVVEVLDEESIHGDR